MIGEPPEILKFSEKAKCEVSHQDAGFRANGEVAAVGLQNPLRSTREVKNNLKVLHEYIIPSVYAAGLISLKLYDIEVTNIW